MTRTVIMQTLFLTLLVTVSGNGQSLDTIDQSPGQQAIEKAARNQQYAFLLFYRGNDAATSGMHRILTEALKQRKNATVVSVRITDAAETALVEKFDATRMSMPAVVSIAPNGAITGVFPQRISVQRIASAIVSPGEAECVKALQDEKLVLLCVQPAGKTPIPDGVRQFLQDEEFKGRSQLVSLQAADPAEAQFLRQLGLPNAASTSNVVFMAPPGVMVGKFKGTVTREALMQKLTAAGKCCEDPNCKHQRAAGSKRPSRR